MQYLKHSVDLSIPIMMEKKGKTEVIGHLYKHFSASFRMAIFKKAWKINFIKNLQGIMGNF